MEKQLGKACETRVMEILLVCLPKETLIRKLSKS